MGARHSKAEKEKRYKTGSRNALADIHATRERNYETEELAACSTNKQEQNNDLIQMSILKLYSMIKEEMELTTTKDILNYLHSTNTMSKKDHDRIKGCRKRRPTIELLLQTVLMGGKEMQEAFKHALASEEQQENKPHRISKKLDEVKLTDQEHKVYQAVYNGKPDTFQNISSYLLAKCRTVVNTVDSDEHALVELMDKLLTRFNISIAEYVDIKNSPGGFEARLIELEDVLSRRPVEVYEDLLSMFQDLDKHNGTAMSKNFVHVTNVERSESLKRKLENETLPDAKRQRVLDPKIENDIISNADSSADIKSKAEELGLEYDSSSKGSIVLKFYPKAKEWWDIIRRGCEEGTIANYSIYLLKDNEMPEGEYVFKFKLFRKLQADGKTYVVEFHWENVPNDCSAKGSRLEVNLKLLEEELEITENLMSLLKTNNIVDVGIEDNLKQIEKRGRRNLFLLEQIEKRGEKGYEILKNYIKDANESLYNDMVCNEKILGVGEQFDNNAGISSRTRSKTNDLVYSATLIIDVKHEDSVAVQGQKRKTSSSSCVSIRKLLNPICYFKKEVTDEQKAIPDKINEINERTFADVFQVESDGAVERQGSRKKRKSLITTETKCTSEEYDKMRDAH